MSQILYVDPEKKYIMVRLGEKWDTKYWVMKLGRLLMRNSPIVEKKW